MSETSSLYLKIKLSEKSYNHFLSSKPVHPSNYNDWTNILSEEDKKYITITDNEISKLNYFSRFNTIQEYLDSLISNSTNGTKSVYNQSTNSWYLVIPDFEENYLNIIEQLSFLRAIEAYKDIPGGGFILIYTFLFGFGPKTLLEIETGKSFL